MAFQKLRLPDCPECGASAVRVLESKKAEHGQRRRKHCEACNYRFTTYEISSEHYSKYDHFLSMHQELCKIIGYVPGEAVNRQEPQEEQNKCMECSNNLGASCAFEFPEYNTLDSYDCNHYSLP